MQRRCKNVLAGVAPSNIKGGSSFRNVESGLEMLFAWPYPVSDWLTQRSVTRPSETSFEVVVHSETPVFITTAIAVTVREVESGSTFRETCLATEV